MQGPTRVHPATLKQIYDHDFTKELKDFEYETKFDIRARTNDSLHILKKVETCFKNVYPFVLCKIRAGDKLVTRVLFFTHGGFEYTLFRYRGARMLKVKKHTILTRGALPVFKSTEKLLIDRNDFARKLHAVRHRFKRHNYRLVNIREMQNRLGFSESMTIGTMIKTRVKDFVLDTRDGRVYSVGITFCASKNKVQKQLEVEYAGYVPGFRSRRQHDEQEIKNRLIELSQYIYRRLPAILKPSTERKFDFVKRVCCA